MGEKNIDVISEKSLEVIGEDGSLSDSDYKKSKRQLEILLYLLRFCNNKENRYYLNQYLSELNGRFSIEETGYVLNQMAEVGDIVYFAKEGDSNELKKKTSVDFSKTPLSEKILFSLSERPYRMLLTLAEIVYYKVTDFTALRKEIKEQDRELKSIQKGIKEIDTVKNNIEAEAKKIETAGQETKKALDDLEQHKKEALDKISDQAETKVSEKIEAELRRDGKIGSFLQGIQRDFIQYMAIFIAIFSLINLNLNSLKNRNVVELISMNLSLVASITGLAALLEFVLNKSVDQEREETSSWVLVVMAAVLWITAIAVSLVMAK